MATRIFSRLLSALILGVALAVACFVGDVKDARLGISRYLYGAEVRFYDIDTNGGALFVHCLVGIITSAAVFVIYELLALGIYKILDRLDRKVTREITSS